MLKLHPQRRTVFSGHIIYPADALEQIIRLTEAWWPNIGPKETLMIALTTAPDAPTVVRILLKEANCDILFMF